MKMGRLLQIMIECNLDLYCSLLVFFLSFSVISFIEGRKQKLFCKAKVTHEKISGFEEKK